MIALIFGLLLACGIPDPAACVGIQSPAGPAQAGSLETQLAQARSQFEASDYGAAIAALDPLILNLEPLAPKDPIAWRLLPAAYELRARARWLLARSDEAIADLRALLRIAPAFKFTDKGVSARLVRTLEDIRKTSVGSIVLNLTAPEDAEFELDGMPFTQAAGPIPVAVGRHTLSGRRPGCRSASQTFSVSAGATTEVVLTLERIAATVSLVTSPPGVEVRLDGLWQGRTEAGAQSSRWTEPIAKAGLQPGVVSRPFVIDELGIGAHSVQVSLNCYRGSTARLEVARLTDYFLAPMKLERAAAAVKIQAADPGIVFVDGVSKGPLPAQIEVCEGAHVIEVRGQNGRFTDQREWKAGDSVTLTAVMTNAPPLAGPEPGPAELIALRQLESGRAFLREGKGTEALKDFRSVADSFPSTSVADDALLEIARYYWWTVVRKPQDRTRVDETTKAVRAIIAKYPISNAAPEAFLLLGAVALEGGRYDEALADFERVWRLFPNSEMAPRAMLEVARAYLDVRGDAVRASAMINKLLAEYPASQAAKEALTLKDKLATPPVKPAVAPPADDGTKVRTPPVAETPAAPLPAPSDEQIAITKFLSGDYKGAADLLNVAPERLSPRGIFYLACSHTALVVTGQLDQPALGGARAALARVGGSVRFQADLPYISPRILQALEPKAPETRTDAEPPPARPAPSPKAPETRTDVTMTGAYPFEVLDGGRVISPASTWHSFTVKGRPRLRIRNQDYFLDRFVQIDGANNYRWLAPGLGRLTVSGSEACVVSISGRNLGEPPLMVTMAAGSYVAEFTCGGPARRQGLAIVADETTRLTVR
jgi:tetratricopeptide (TPR) repeat protein